MTRRTFLILLAVVLFVNSLGLFCDIFLQDSSLYAVISKSLAASGNYWDLYVNGKDWLDKPHFPFWVCALFIKLLGANTFSYKLASLLFFFLGLYYTYLLARKLYGQQVAYLSVLILGSSVHILLSNNDARAEAILLGVVMGATYYLHELKETFTFKNLVLAALYSAAAIMTKGVFVLIVLYSAVWGDVIVKREFRKFLDIRWGLVLVLTFLGVLPELYAVYHQFDLHPEKVVFDKQNVSGLRFFLWDSQLGRFFNTGPIKGKGDVFFFLHTMLWAFAPWVCLGFFALFRQVQTLRSRVSRSNEYLTLFGFSVMFLVFSLSKFQLPHYTNILFPFLAILIAAALVDQSNKWLQVVVRYSVNLYAVLFAVVILLMAYFFRTDDMWFALAMAVAVLLVVIYINRSAVTSAYKYLILGVLSSLLFFTYLNLGFYPKLLTYQHGSQMAHYLNQNYPKQRVFVNFDDWLLQYYTQTPCHKIETLEQLMLSSKDRRALVVADDAFYNQIKQSNLIFRELKRFDSFLITRLTTTFLHYKTRPSTLTYYYLLAIESH